MHRLLLWENANGIWWCSSYSSIYVSPNRISRIRIPSPSSWLTIGSCLETRGTVLTGSHYCYPLRVQWLERNDVDGICIWLSLRWNIRMHRGLDPQIWILWWILLVGCSVGEDPHIEKKHVINIAFTCSNTVFRCNIVCCTKQMTISHRLFIMYNVLAVQQKCFQIKVKSIKMLPTVTNKCLVLYQHLSSHKLQ